jgi:DNA polymerase/3'-5' exonuclease PolX
MSTTTTKRALSEAIGDAKALREMFDASTFERWHLAGSCRRRVPFISDVEHVVIPRWGDVADPNNLFAVPVRTNLFMHRLDELVAAGAITKHLYGAAEGFRWGEKYRGADFRGSNHEFFLCDVDNFGPTFAIRTGPGLYSQMLVTKLRQNGLRNHEGKVWRCRGPELDLVEPVSCPTEEEYFSMCGVPWVKPEERFEPRGER